MLFILDEYKGSVELVFSPTATFRVKHSTDVEQEEDFQDCWDSKRECHYTKTISFSYNAQTTIKSVELMLDDDVYTPVTLNSETVAKLKAAIESAAERQEMLAKAA